MPFLRTNINVLMDEKQAKYLANGYLFLSALFGRESVLIAILEFVF